MSAEQGAFAAYRATIGGARQITFATAARQLAAYSLWQRIYDPDNAEENIDFARKALARRLCGQ
jgi:hypothetical protein